LKTGIALPAEGNSFGMYYYCGDWTA